MILHDTDTKVLCFIYFFHVYIFNSIHLLLQHLPILFVIEMINTCLSRKTEFLYFFAFIFRLIKPPKLLVVFFYITMRQKFINYYCMYISYCLNIIQQLIYFHMFLILY